MIQVQPALLSVKEHGGRDLENVSIIAKRTPFDIDLSQLQRAAKGAKLDNSILALIQIIVPAKKGKSQKGE